MVYDFGLLTLHSPTGNGQTNDPDDVEALDNALRRIGEYHPPSEYSAGPQRYATGSMIAALERFQEQNGLKVDGVAKPEGPTERAINNRLLTKPRGAGLLYDPPPPLSDTVGNGFQNERKDVASVQRQLGALDYLPEDAFDQPHGFIDEMTTKAITRFQSDRGLTPDGWISPGGETERALRGAISNLASSRRSDWFAFVDRAARAQRALLTQFGGIGHSRSLPEADEGESGLVLTKGPPAPPGPAPTRPGSTGQSPRTLEPRGLLEIPPRFRPRPIPDLRGPLNLPRDLEWANPGQRPSKPQAPPTRPGVDPIPPMRDSEPVSIRDLDRVLRRQPLPDPNKLETYLPEPGSPLRIPILDHNPDGRKGNPETVETNTTVAKAIEEACKSVMRNAKVEYYAGPGSISGGEKKVGRTVAPSLISRPESTTRASRSTSLAILLRLRPTEHPLLARHGSSRVFSETQRT